MNTNPEWKPIESAPKDGTEILAWRHDCGQFIASYTSADAFPLTQAEIDAMDEATLFAKSWFTQWPQALRLEGSEVPTLWQPMRADPCATCNGHGMIGGPSYYAPDEGGEPCPDCSALPATPDEPYTVVLDPDPRGVSVGVYQGPRCVYNGAHPIPTGATGERDWELSCDECNGSGQVFVKHQVAERKTDVQEFKEECEICEGRGFNIAFEDIPGISEYVKSFRPAAMVATGADGRSATYGMTLDERIAHVG
ncbi:MAG TPA: hypothetical protein DHL02_20625, partial [Achromobacter sp.]|nr:hypothetical protein [Achromobacter sp.]